MQIARKRDCEEVPVSKEFNKISGEDEHWKKDDEEELKFAEADDRQTL